MNWSSAFLASLHRGLNGAATSFMWKKLFEKVGELGVGGAGDLDLWVYI
jgi:hypothetical protein